MKFRYEWRVKTSDGRLLEAEPVGPYYNEMYFSDYDTEDAAYDDWVKIASAYPSWTEREMVLIKIFSRPDI